MIEVNHSGKALENYDHKGEALNDTYFDAPTVGLGWL
jgi:hypothetical protein